MPGVYREKDCPACGGKHRKKGLYCSQACSNTSRTYTNETKNKISRGLREYYKTPEGIALATVNNRRVNADKRGEEPPVTIDQFAVDIPELPPDLYDYTNYDKAEDW